MKQALPTVNEDPSSSMNPDRSSNNLRKLRQNKEALQRKQLKEKAKMIELQQRRMAKEKDSESGDFTDDDEEEDHVATLSIVRFAREVNQRRISEVDDARRSSNVLDITNFPSGPLTATAAAPIEEETIEMEENGRDLK